MRTCGTAAIIAQKCQQTNKERRILAKQQQLLPVNYFHVVFTLQQELNNWCLHYPKQMY